MITKLKTLNFLRKHGFVLLIAAVVIYAVYKIFMLDNQLSGAYNTIDNMQKEYTQLEYQYEKMNESFDDFVVQVNNDLKQQEEIRKRIETINADVREDIKELNDTFKKSPDGTDRDYRKLLDEKPNLLENIFNRGTEGVADDFKNLGND